MPAPMDPFESMGFYSIWNAYKRGDISEKTKLQRLLPEMFSYMPLPNETGQSSQVEKWADQDIVIAAIVNCMNQGLQPPPGAQDALIDLILQTKRACLEDLRNRDHGQEAILGIPVLYQLILAAAFKNGNRSLVREMIAAEPPAPGHDLVFSSRRIRYGCRRTFGDSEGEGHIGLEGQADNGCDLFADMILAGWAVPRDYMQIWAATSNHPEPGKRLLDILVMRGINIRERAAWFAIHHDRFDLFAYILKLHTPKDEDQCNEMLREAAKRDVKWLKLLFRHGVNNYNRVEKGWAPPPIRREDRIPYQTPLHIATQYGNAEVVEWLIRHGAEATEDYHCMDPYDIAKENNLEEVLAVFDRFPGCRAKRSGECIIL